MSQNGRYPTEKFAIHDLVTVQFVNLDQGFLAAYQEQMAPALRQVTSGQADIVVEFRDKVTTSGLRYVGQNAAAYDDQGFYLLDPVKGKVVAQIPFDRIGGQPRIICRKDARRVPLLAELVNLAFVQKGVVPVHAAGFVYDGVGIVVMGWPKGGKTGAMLAFMNHGAEYVGDEWLLLADGGRQMLGLPGAVSLSEWQLAQMPGLAPRMSAGQRAVFKSIHGLTWLHGKLNGGPFKRSYMTKMLGKGLPSFKRQLKIYRSPQKIFRDQIGDLKAPVDTIFWIVSHDAGRVDIVRRDSQEIAQRMAAANEHEQGSFWEAYQSFCYAFPDRRNDYLLSVRSRQRALMTDALEGQAVYELAHPYGGSLENLFDKMLPYCAPSIDRESIRGMRKLEPVT